MLKKIKNILFGGYSPDIALRYLPVVDIITKNKLSSSSILEVGSGDYGITTYLNKKITGLDIEFSGEESKWLKKIKYQGGKFPFASGQFDLILTVDSLEHIAPAQRRNHINEIMRVARSGAIFVVPCGQEAAKHDKRLQAYFYKTNGYYDRFLQEHIANDLPPLAKLIEFINQGAEANSKTIKIIKQKRLLNIYLREALMKCKISHSVCLSIAYYLGLILVPVRCLLNFGQCYRYLIYVKIM